VSFQASAYLRKATSRAKSDVANKLVSMFLHEVSRKATAEIGLSVTDQAYVDAVVKMFGANCAYCGRALETDRAAVEHLDGMNRFRVGLHIAGNVILACNRCNREKRRDDSLTDLVLANNGWECFLSHDSCRCDKGCKTCAYWRGIWAVDADRKLNMKRVREKISVFRSNYREATEWGDRARLALRHKMDALYRECQEFATVRIKSAVEELFEELHKTSVNRP
jgi:hypothetical protein